MRKWILDSLLVGMLGILAASCSREADDDPTADEKVQVMFTIALDSPSGASRATWGDNYDDDDNDYLSDDGDEFDNLINLNQLFVQLTLNGTTYDVNRLFYLQVPDNNVYKVMGEVNTTTEISGNAKIEVYANVDRFGQETFTTDYDTHLGKGVAGIPMWGVQTANISLTPGVLTELEEPIYLLRAMAKIEVTLSTGGTEECTLADVTMSKAMTSGNVMPALMKENATEAITTDELQKTTELGIEEVFNPMAGDIHSDVSFIKGGNNTYYLYVPEYKLTDDEELEIRPTLQWADENANPTQETLPFVHGEYKEGTFEKAWDVVRNHYYRYLLSVKRVDGKLYYQVTDMDEHNIDIEFN